MIICQRPSGGGGVAIGGSITGGTAGRILFEGAGPVLADSANLTFDGTTLYVGTSVVSPLYQSYNVTGTDYERAFLSWSANVFTIGTEAGGLGSNRNLKLTPAGGITTIDGQLAMGSVYNGVPYVHSRIHVKAPSANEWGFVNEASGNDCLVSFGHNGSAGVFAVSYFNTGGYTPLEFRTSGLTRLTIATGGAITAAVSFSSPIYATQSGAGDPSTSDIPDGYWTVWKNSGTGAVKVWANVGGSLVSVALS